MKRGVVLISQRLESVPGRSEERDTLDSKFAEILWGMGWLPCPLPNRIENPKDFLISISPAAVVLSGGENFGVSPGRDSTELAAIDYAVRDKIPLLGICRGMQVINRYFGGEESKVEGHVRTEHEIKGSLTSGEPKFVNSYHSRGIRPSGLGTSLVAEATAPDSTVEAFRHSHLPIRGIMWHPEREEVISDLSRAVLNLSLGLPK